MNLKKIIIPMCIILVFISFLDCSKKHSVRDYKIKIIGVDDTFVPMGFKNDKGEITGFDIDLAREVFKELGYKVRFQTIDWNMKEVELNNKNIDAIWNGYSINNERKKAVSFSKPYLKNKQVIVVLKNSHIKCKGDLKGKAIAIQEGSSAYEALEKNKKLLNEIKNKDPIIFDSNSDVFMDVEFKRSDALVIDEVMAKYYIKKGGENKFRILDDNFGSEEYAVGMRKSDKKLLEKINIELDKIKKNGILDKLSRKWFG